MRFMMLIKSDARSEAGILPDEKILSAMGNYNTELVKAGVTLGGEGLQATSKGARVRYAGGNARVIDGPFAEAKELVAGFWLIQASSKDDAIDWARRVPGAEGEIEIRQIVELSDFPVDPSETPEGWREQEQRLRDAAADAAKSSGGSGGSGGAQVPARTRGTTRFMILLKADHKTEAGVLPDEKALAAMGGLMEDMAKAGVLLSGEGLHPSAKAARIKLAGDKRVVIDGPFSETKELIAGYSIIQAKSKDEAVAWAKRFLKIHVEGTHVEEGEVEVRQIFELSDFPVDPAEKPDGWRRQEQRLRETLEESAGS